jgi:hypothetical protein
MIGATRPNYSLRTLPLALQYALVSVGTNIRGMIA